LAYSTGFGSYFPELRNWSSAGFFLSRGLVGDVDVTMIYQKKKMPGSLLTAVFVLGVYMVLLNVFYALMLYAYSQTREHMLQQGASPEDASSFDMLVEFKQAVINSVDWEKMMKKITPGLHARTLQTWRRHENKIRKRLERRLEIENSQIRQIAVDKNKSGYTLMPFNRTAGEGFDLMSLTMNASKPRGAKRDAEVESEASDASMDIGPLSPPVIKKKMDYNKRMGNDDPLHVPLADLRNAVSALGDQLSSRIAYIGGEVKQEMMETREVMSGIRDVCGLLDRRVKDLDSIQKQSL